MIRQQRRRQRQQPRSFLWLVPAVHILLSIALLAYHVHAEAASIGEEPVSVTERILSGPIHWTNMDAAVFCILIMMGMELLSWIVRHFGGTQNEEEMRRTSQIRWHVQRSPPF